ncbi:MAG: AraC family transcriptional regulator [Pseudomonas sp.]|nr:AraC family transcriptional regulator [Pseudomonas sp.]
MDVRIKQLPSARIAYQRLTGPYGPAIGVFWREVFGEWMVRNGLLHRVRYGIGLDDPQITPAAECRYDACVEVPDSFVATPPIAVRDLPGGEHAVAWFKGTGAEIGPAWMALFAELPGLGWQADGAYFERYAQDSSYDPQTGVMSCELCVPVKRSSHPTTH